ncbi:transaldolase family protein [Kitasatospora sp. NPDC049258]|uniref:transaldolase family protein n=1 Tax=Kitasatospora sp. NPDC049258 TaxID=3155394 RepID=UPI003435B102
MAEGVSPWLDGVHRGLLVSGALTRLVAQTGVRGATSDPLALADALAHGTAYREQLLRLAHHRVSVDGAVWATSVWDQRLACEELRQVFESTHGYDGLVSMDLDPRLAHDAAATVTEAVELARAVGRRNALVKIPATTAGLSAIRDCVGLGIGVHATEIYSVSRYTQVVAAYFDGLEIALASDHRLSGIASVASLPVGRVDAEVDGLLGELGSEDARALLGQASLAAARLLYRVYEEHLGGERWRTLRAAGARPQRLMWTDTARAGRPRPGTGYVESLVSWGTVNAMSLPTLEDAARHSTLRGDTLMGQHEAAQAVLDRLGRLGISYDAVVRRLEAESVGRLTDSWLLLRSSVAEQLRMVAVSAPVPQLCPGSAPSPPGPAALPDR